MALLTSILLSYMSVYSLHFRAMIWYALVWVWQNDEDAEDAYLDAEDYEEDLKLAQQELYASDDDDEDGVGGDARYEDFFGRRRGGKGGGKEDTMEDESDEEDGEEDGDMTDEDEDEEEGSEDGSEEGSEDGSEEGSDAGAMSAATLTNHQRRKAALAAQIAELEKESIGVKEWELRGEVKSGDRPENSLLAVSADIERCVAFRNILDFVY